MNATAMLVASQVDPISVAMILKIIVPSILVKVGAVLFTIKMINATAIRNVYNLAMAVVVMILKNVAPMNFVKENVDGMFAKIILSKLR